MEKEKVCTKKYEGDFINKLVIKTDGSIRSNILSPEYWSYSLMKNNKDYEKFYKAYCLTKISEQEELAKALDIWGPIYDSCYKNNVTTMVEFFLECGNCHFFTTSYNLFLQQEARVIKTADPRAYSVFEDILRKYPNSYIVMQKDRYIYNGDNHLYVKEQIPESVIQNQLLLKEDINNQRKNDGNIFLLPKSPYEKH